MVVFVPTVCYSPGFSYDLSLSGVNCSFISARDRVPTENFRENILDAICLFALRAKRKKNVPTFRTDEQSANKIIESNRSYGIVRAMKINIIWLKLNVLKVMIRNNR